MGLFSSLSTAHAATYTVTDLGTLASGTFSQATAINASGQIVGWANVYAGSGFHYHAFLYANGVMTDLGTPAGGDSGATATAISASGQIAGWAMTDQGHSYPFRYANGAMTGLRTPLAVGDDDGSLLSAAQGINDSGVVVGLMAILDPDGTGVTQHAFRYANGAMTDLGTFGGVSGATAINASGQIAGYSVVAGNWDAHVFLYANGVMTDLGTLGGYSNSLATAINASGQIVGYSYTDATNGYRAFRYANGVMTDLGTLSGNCSTQATGINASGQIVGTLTKDCASQGSTGSFLYSGGQMVDLSSLLPANSGWTGLKAAAINDAGQIAGFGIINGQCHAFLLSPTQSLGLTVNKTGGLGTVTSAPAGINCGTTCNFDFAENARVTLTAKADTGYGFSGWSGDCVSTALTCTVTMDAAKDVTALFVSVPKYLLTVSNTSIGTGSGIVTSLPSGINCGNDCTESYASGTSITLNASATAGSTFAGWTDCTAVQTNPAQCVVVITAAKTVKATFTKSQQHLTVRKTGNSADTGLVASIPTGIYCGTDCTEPYSLNTKVYLMAIPATGTTFDGWTNCTPVSAVPGNRVCMVTMDKVQNMTANFGGATSQPD